MKKDQYYLDKSLGYKLFQGSRLMNNRLNRNFKVNGFLITYEQWQILSRLYHRDGQTQNELAISNERDQASVSRLINNMIKGNLVKRVSQKDDRRINLIFLTKDAIEVREVLEGLASKTIQQASDGVSQEDLEITLRTLDRIRKNLS